MNLVGWPSDSFYFNLLMHAFNASQTWRESSRVSACIVAPCFLNALRLSSKWPRQRHGRFALDPPGNPFSSRASRTRIYVGVGAPRTSNVSRIPENLREILRVAEHGSPIYLPLPPNRPPIISRVKSFPREESGGGKLVLVQLPTFVRFFRST